MQKSARQILINVPHSGRCPQAQCHFQSSNLECKQELGGFCTLFLLHLAITLELCALPTCALTIPDVFLLHTQCQMDSGHLTLFQSITHCSPFEALQRDCERGLGCGAGDDLSFSSTSRVSFHYLYPAAKIPSLILIYFICSYFLNLRGALWYTISFNPNTPASYISYIIQFHYSKGKQDEGKNIHILSKEPCWITGFHAVIKLEGTHP